MRLPVFIAWRYFRSGKSHHIINQISRISMIAIAVGTAALVVVLSVFNGFESLVASLFNTFDPDIKIELAEGKTFDAGNIDREKIESIPGIISYTEVIEDNVLLRHDDKQYIVTMKGVSRDFLKNNPLDSMLISGNLKMPGRNSAIAGYGVAYYLNINYNELPADVSVYVPNRTANNFSIMSNAFSIDDIKVTGIFSIQQDFDTKYVLVPIGFMRSLMDYSNEITCVEIRLEPGVKGESIEKQIEAICGENYKVLNRFEQQKSLYKIMRAEKLAIYLILTFILIIAAFNMIGSQTMVMLDKQKNSAILSSLGATKETIRNVFITQGLIVSLLGAMSGLAFGAMVCLLQMKFGLIRFDTGTTFVVNAYPVVMQWGDFVLIFLTVTGISLFSALFPASKITSKYLQLTTQEK